MVYGLDGCGHGHGLGHVGHSPDHVGHGPDHVGHSPDHVGENSEPLSTVSSTWRN